MPKLKNILVAHTTHSKEEDARSTADFTLEIAKGSGTPVSKTFPKDKNCLHRNEPARQPGQLDLYQFDVSADNVNSDEPGFRITMKIQSGDPWLPQSIFILGHTDIGQIVLLGYHPQWGSDTRRTPIETTMWFDKKVGTSDLVGLDTRVISS